MDVEKHHLPIAQTKASKNIALLLFCGILLGAANGALAGVAFAFILSAFYGWNPYFASIKGAMACSIIGLPTGFIGSCASIFINQTKLKVAVYAACGMVLAMLLFLAFAENDSEVKTSFLYGTLMGSTIGIMISACMFGLEQLFSKSS